MPLYLNSDQSGGKVLFKYMDGAPAYGGVQYFCVYDQDSGLPEEMDIDSSFYSQTIYGTQLHVVE